MAVVQPFGALRYDDAKTGPLESVVAPPYDVISDAERGEYRARSPYNVVHLTLPDSEDEAARLFSEWRRDGVLRAEEPALWALEQQYVGPDGVSRTRTGIVAALRVEPYARRVVLPHERTHRGPKAGRLRLLRAVGAQLEPIFLLYRGAAPLEPPAREPDLAVEGARLWRLADDSSREEVSAFFAEKQLLIADGHHRYETALAFHDEEGTPESAFLMVVLVSASDPGLTIFPTHRIARRFEPDGLRGLDEGPLAALRRLDELPREKPAAVVYAGGRTLLAEGEGPQLDTAFVESLGPESVSYTPRAEDAVAAVDAGEAAAAFLLRPTRIEDVFAVAERGDVMPQKSTYFYPKLLSGLLFQPL